MENISEKLLKQIQNNSTKDESFYAGLQQEMEVHITGMSGEIGADVSNILYSILSGADQDSIEGLKIRISRLNELKQYLSDTKSLGSDDQKIIFPIIMKLENAIKNHIKQKSSKLNKLKNVFSNIIDNEAMVSAFGDNIVAELFFDGMKGIKRKLSNNRQKQKKEIKLDKESLYKGELQLNKNKPNTESYTNSENDQLDYSKPNTADSTINELSPYYENEAASRSGAFSSISGINKAFETMNFGSQIKNNNDYFIEESLLLVIDSLKPLEKILTNTDSLVLATKIAEKDRIKQHQNQKELQEELEIQSENQRRLVAESLLENTSNGNNTSKLFSNKDKTNTISSSGGMGGSFGGSLMGVLSGSILKSIGPLLIRALPIAAIITSIGKSIFDGFQGYFKSGEWGVASISGTIGGILGGMGSGISGAFANAGKWGLMGSGIGFMVGGPFGAIAGGALGGILGGILGFIGGERISRAIDSVTSWASDTTEVAIMSIGNLFTEMWDGFIDLIKDAFDWVQDLFSKAKILYIEGLKGILDGIISVLPEDIMGVKVPGVDALKNFSNVLGEVIKKEEDTIKIRKERSDQRNNEKEQKKKNNKQQIQNTMETQANNYNKKLEYWEGRDTKSKNQASSNLIKQKSSGNIDNSNVNETKKRLLADLQAQGITDPTAQANILANVQAESNFKSQGENLNYSPSTLMRLYGPGSGNKVRVRTLEEAKSIVDKGPEAVGNLIYGGRMGNSDEEGYKYRGRGLVQLTGKDNYESMSKKLGVDLVNNPDMANDPEIASKIVAQYYADRKGRFDYTDINQVAKATGHAAGMQENLKRAQYAKSIQGDMQSGKLTLGNDPILLASNELVPQGNANNYKIVNKPSTQGLQSQGQVVNVNNVNNSKNIQNNSSTQNSGGSESHGTSSRTESFMRSLMA